MRTVRTLLATVVAAAALASCTSGPAPDTATGPAPATSAAPPSAQAPASGAEAEVRETFLAYNQALGARDFAKACAVNAPETTAQLMQAMTAQGVPAGSCEEAFSAALSAPSAAATVDEIVKTLTVDGVTVDGDQATVSWTAQAQGKPRSTTSRFSLVDGRWLLQSGQS